MDGPAPCANKPLSLLPECTAPRYINDVTAAEIYESRVCEDSHPRPPRPKPVATHVARLPRSTCKPSTRSVYQRRHADCVTTNAHGTGDPLEIGSLVDKRREMKGLALRPQPTGTSLWTESSQTAFFSKMKVVVAARNVTGRLNRASVYENWERGFGKTSESDCASRVGYCRNC